MTTFATETLEIPTGQCVGSSNQPLQESFPTFIDLQPQIITEILLGLKALGFPREDTYVMTMIQDLSELKDVVGDILQLANQEGHYEILDGKISDTLGLVILKYIKNDCEG